MDAKLEALMAWGRVDALETMLGQAIAQFARTDPGSRGVWFIGGDSEWKWQ